MLETSKKLTTIKYDGDISISTASRRTAITWSNQELTWSDFLKKINDTVRTKESGTEYHKMRKPEQDDIKDVGGFVGGRLKGGRRKADKVFNRSILTLDIDFGEEGMAETVDMLFGHAYALYSTHKHTAENPRLRMIIPLTEPVTAEQYAPLAKKVAEQIGIDYFDDTTYQAHRLMYWPSTSSDAPFFFDYNDTTWLNPNDMLDKYLDWRDPLEWPTSSRQQRTYSKLADKQEDPDEKPGLVGAFCRTYTIQEAIETFLADRYELYQEGRYTYVDGSTAGGLVLYDDGKFAYSHHGTDPTSSQLVNAFDLVRLHKFGEQDEDVEAGVKSNQRPSYKAMITFAQKDEGVKEETASARISAAQDDFDEIEVSAEDKKDVKWAKKLQHNKMGEVEASVPNLVLVLENDPLLKGKIATNEFSNRLMLLKSTSWKRLKKSENWTDADDAGLRDYIESYYGIYHKSKTEDALRVISERQKFHPIRDYLKTLKWDGEERLDTLFIDYLGAEDSELNRAITRKSFTAAVARVMEPGIKFDYMVTLYGAQGIGKSMLINRMGKSWFSDSLTTVSGKEAFEALQGAWIIEMAELSATRKTDVENIKHFISKREDRFRVAYGRHTEDFPRQCVFFGTTNDANFLKDKTGGRRFWPVTVRAEHRKCRWSELKSDEIDQLWAEAKHRYEDGESLYLSDAMEADMRLIQEAHTEESPWAGLVQEYLDTLLPENWDAMELSERRLFLSEDFGEAEGTVERDRVCALEVWCECLGNDKRRFSPTERREVNDILRRVDGWKPNDSTSTGRLKFGKLYGAQKAYVRENDLI
ncbi:virulence-associated E family protein [Aureibacillus halotolerans]|uniref:Putative P-loop ATPase n=1 Tax=Aureibacillus halotolerans TaxID=1508390 RepID=A0A4R6TZ24_9BACI|nr:virulence-associated E family protein [Aureibacillus halotolerans]TDQ39220.1 putative P-loop ATPase [Aureibacillus halotolerans]